MARVFAVFIAIGLLTSTPAFDRWLVVIAASAGLLLGLTLPGGIWLNDVRRRLDDIDQGWELPL